MCLLYVPNTYRATYIDTFLKKTHTHQFSIENLFTDFPMEICTVWPLVAESARLEKKPWRLRQLELHCMAFRLALKASPAAAALLYDFEDL